MPDELMSDARQKVLLKAAEETIGLMNVGIEPSAAMFKVAQDAGLNDHEVDVVTHAVNNSRQLAHLQTTTGDDRAASFPLIDPDKVRAYGELQPTTNADENTGSRYGSQEEAGDNVEAKIDAPDATCVHKKQADYRLRKPREDHLSALRAGWGLPSTGIAKVAAYEDPNPFSHIDYYRIGIEEARLRYTQKCNECTQAMYKVAEELRRIDAPAWCEVEKTAAALGVEKATLDFIAAVAQIEKFGGVRADLSVKTASTLKVSQRVMDIAQHCVRADTFWKEAADIHCAHEILSERQERAYSDLMPKEATISANLGELAEPIEKAPEEFGGVNPDIIRSAIGGGEAPSTSAPTGPSHGIRQELRNNSARAQLEGLLSDEYIGGYNLPEVIEAYNSAMSVNPNFGHAELVSYLRQHLATQGGVPLDLQIRARPKGKLTGEEGQP